MTSPMVRLERRPRVVTTMPALDSMMVTLSLRATSSVWAEIGLT